MSRSLTRRELISGPSREASETIAHISSLVIQATPARLSTVREAVRQYGGDVAVEDARGKIVAVLECAHSTEIADFSDRMSKVPGVISANLVYHGIDEGDAGPRD